MGTFKKGDIVICDFPFSNLTQSKLRPALVITQNIFCSYLLCPITSQCNSNEFTIALSDIELVDGGLNIDSLIRTDVLFTINENKIDHYSGCLNESKIQVVIEKLIRFIRK